MAGVAMGAAVQAAVMMAVAMGEAAMAEAATGEAEMAGVEKGAAMHAAVMMAVAMGEAEMVGVAKGEADMAGVATGAAMGAAVQATVTMGAAMQAAVTMVVAMGEAEMGEAATREAEMAGVAMEAEVEATVMMAVEMGEASVSSNSPVGGRSPSSRTALPRRAYRPCPNPPFPLGLDTPDSVKHSVLSPPRLAARLFLRLQPLAPRVVRSLREQHVMRRALIGGLVLHDGARNDGDAVCIELTFEAHRPVLEECCKLMRGHADQYEPACCWRGIERVLAVALELAGGVRQAT